MNSIIDFSSKKFIFCFLIVSKLLLLPFIYFLFIHFDDRANALFLLPDLTKYEDSQNIANIFNFGTWVPNFGYMSLLYLVKKFSVLNAIKLFFYSFISLIVISFAQTLVLDLVFKENKFASDKLKLTSLFLSVFNFYILIYSFKPSSDVFGCFGISILILALIRSQNVDISERDKFFLPWGFVFLITCLFRNNLILVLPFIPLTKISKFIQNEIVSYSVFKRFFTLSAITALLVTNFFQLVSSFIPYGRQQVNWGFISISNELNMSSSLSFIKDIFVFISSKFVYLLSAREAVGMSGDWLINLNGDVTFTSNPLITNVLTSIILFAINILGLIAIFKFFSNNFKKSFLFSLIPLIPILSFVAHHRYFLPYSLITTASLPFLFKNNMVKSKIK